MVALPKTGTEKTMNKTIDSTHSLYYNCPVFPTVADVVASLEGIDRVARLVPGMLKGLAPGGPVSVEVYVSAVQAGSLRDNFLVRLIFGDEEAFNAWTLKLRQNMGIEYINGKFPFLGPLMQFAIVGGLFYGMTKMAGCDGAGTGDGVSLRNAHHNIIINGANTFNMDPESFRAAFEAGTGNPLNLASNACKVIRPAKSAAGTSISIDDDDNIVLTPEVIADSPSRIDRSPNDLVEVTVEGATIVIRAADLDKNKGWHIVVPDRCERRLPAEIGEGVDITRVAMGREIAADISVSYVIDDEGNRKYRKVKLLAIRQ